MSAFLGSLTAVVIVSLISLLGVLTLVVRRAFLERIVGFLVGFSAGALIGDALFHLLPEHIEEFGFDLNMSILIIVGIIIFFIMEKFIHWHHCHDEHAHHRVGYMNLIGDAVHNFLDGVVIAASFLVSQEVGIVTTLAVIFHEIPQEIGDFGILIHSKFSTKKAILLNLLSALTAILGVLFVFAFGQETAESMATKIIPITVGGFLYIALTDIVPELHKEIKLSRSLFQLLSILVGIALMYGLLFLE